MKEKYGRKIDDRKIWETNEIAGYRKNILWNDWIISIWKYPEAKWVTGLFNTKRET